MQYIRDTDLTPIIFSLNSFNHFWHTSGDKVSINELMSWIGCVRWGRQCGMLQDSFENHFRDMFLNVTHIKYITCTHSFKASFNRLLVTTLHARSLFRALIWKDTGYSTRRHLWACNWRARAVSTVPFPHLFDSRLPLKWSGARVWNVYPLRCL